MIKNDLIIYSVVINVLVNINVKRNNLDKVTFLVNTYNKPYCIWSSNIEIISSWISRYFKIIFLVICFLYFLFHSALALSPFILV